MHDENIDYLVERMNMTLVRDMHSEDFTREQVVEAMNRNERGIKPHTPLEAAIKNIMDEIDRQTS